MLSNYFSRKPSNKYLTFLKIHSLYFVLHACVFKVFKQHKHVNKQKLSINNFSWFTWKLVICKVKNEIKFQNERLQIFASNIWCEGHVRFRVNTHDDVCNECKKDIYRTKIEYFTEKNQNIVKCWEVKRVKFKGTVSVISSGPRNKNGYARFTTVLSKGGLNAIKKRFWSLLILLLSRLTQINAAQIQIRKDATINLDRK